MLANAPVSAAVMVASRHSMETSIVSSSGSESTPHLKPVSHQCRSGPRLNSFVPLRYSVDDTRSSSLSLAQSKKRSCAGFESFGRWPIVASRMEYQGDDAPLARL